MGSLSFLPNKLEVCMQLNMKAELKNYIDTNDDCVEVILEELENFYGTDLNSIISIESLKKLFEEEISEYSDKLVGDLTYIDPRTTLGSIYIDEVHSDGMGFYTLCYSYDWSYYSGCDDMDGYGKEEESISFEVKKNGAIDFDFLPHEKPGTYEEF